MRFHALYIILMFRAQNMARKMKNIRYCIISPHMICYARVEVAARMDKIKHGLKAGAARIIFRQSEKTHLMENVIYNEMW